ncbi:MAG: protein TolR [Pseudomonadota bacterium]
MGFSTSGPNRPMSEINVTPLVDVMLVLLIIFMVTAPMMQEGVSVDLPRATGQPIEKKQDVQEVMIAVSGEGGIFLNEKAVTEENLLEQVKEKLAQNPSSEVYLRADKQVPYGKVVRIIGALKGSGITNLGIITSPQDEPAAGK